MQKFLSDTIAGRFIKALLYNSYIPKYDCVLLGDKIVQDTRYVYKSNIIYCTRTGILGEDAKYKTLDDFNINDKNLQVSNNYLSTESFYDAVTHEKLGEYLRYCRGKTGIDLMPLYNCFSNVFATNFFITEDGIERKDNSLAKIAQVKIKFNKPYTIAIDSASGITLAPMFMDGGDYLFVAGENLTTNYYEEKNQVRFISSSDFLTPVLFELDNEDPFYQRYEKYLTLLIQMPSNCDSSIVVLEGDYTNTEAKKIISTEIVDDYDWQYTLTEKEKNELFVSNLSLLRMNDKFTYAFADKLMLYLVGSTITSREDIYKNILRVQEAIQIENYNNSVKDV